MYVILLMMIVYLADQPGAWRDWRPELSPAAGTIIAVSSCAGLVLVAALVTALCRRRMDRAGSWRAASLAERSVGLISWLLLGAHAANVVIFGWLDAIRLATGDLVLIDEILAISPPLLALAALWAIQYPIHRRVREAQLIRKLDEGMPVYPIWTRGQYVLNQARLNFVLMLLPILLIMGWGELIERYWPRDPGAGGGAAIGGEAAELIALAIGAATVFLLAPVMARVLWDTKPLAPGPLRERLLALVATHRTPIRGVLVWNTYGMMINGAVLGIVGPLRYILLTDALLDGLDDDQVEAVMAHEVGHIRRRHMPWLAICILAIFSISSFGVYYASQSIGLIDGGPVVEPSPVSAAAAERVDWAERWREWRDEVVIAGGDGGDSPAAESGEGFPFSDWIEPGMMALTFVIALGGFGWVSRRFERQADTFAVQSMSGMTPRSGDDRRIVSERAVSIMVSALGKVADLNHVPRKARSWRHGSIARRQSYLQRLVGQPCGKLRIDRQIRWIKWSALLVLIGLAVFSALLE